MRTRGVFRGGVKTDAEAPLTRHGRHVRHSQTRPAGGRTWWKRVWFMLTGYTVLCTDDRNGVGWGRGGAS